ncbi:MAG TPA: response regulator, partial [Cryomorphaceae bacterium]|nr:response regulator [Cryomorphaceae bacterium]
MKTVIIDDERLARAELANMLSLHDDIEVIDDCATAQEAVETIDRLKPDLIFLDIQMPGMSGFDLLEDLNHMPMVVFVTAYDEYAIKAFEVNALDYLLKPVDE